MFKKTLLVGAALALSFGASAGPNKGDWEVIFTNAGLGVVNVEDADTQYRLGAELGYFLTMRHEVGFGVWYEDKGGNADGTLSLSGMYRYNVVDSTDKNWWYFGADVVFPTADDNFSKPTYLRPNVGHKWMLSEDIAFDTNLGYSFGVQDMEGIGGDIDPPDLVDLRVGFSIFF